MPEVMSGRKLRVSASFQPFENHRSLSLRVHRAGKPRTLPSP